jgi:hypothetical protein
VTIANAASVSLLATEFCFDALLSECSDVLAASAPASISELSERILKLEQDHSSHPLTLMAELRESIANHERQLEDLISLIEASATDRVNIRSQCTSQFETLAARIGIIERDLALLGTGFDRKISDSLSLVTVRMSLYEQRLEQMRSTSPTPIATAPPVPIPTPSVSPTPPPKKTSWFSKLKPTLSKSLTPVDCPLKNDKPLEGIISYLTRQHGGNVHDKGIVTITAKSVWADDKDSRWTLRNLADVTYDSWFSSKNEPNQWVCWDFKERCIRPTHYTVATYRLYNLKSWVIDGSLTGVDWTEIDRRTISEGLDSRWTASFPVSKSLECRFIRLTQTDKNHSPDGSTTYLNILALHTFEIFGTLLE